MMRRRIGSLRAWRTAARSSSARSGCASGALSSPAPTTPPDPMLSPAKVSIYPPIVRRPSNFDSMFDDHRTRSSRRLMPEATSGQQRRDVDGHEGRLHRGRGPGPDGVGPAQAGPGTEQESGAPGTRLMTGPRHPTATLLLACLAQFMVILDVSVVNVALPSIRHGLGFSEVDLQWVVNAYTVTFAGFLLLGGRAADLLGRRRVFVAGLVLFALTSLAGGLAQSQGWLIAARAAQGLAGAVIAPASLSTLTTTFAEGAARNRAVGIWGAMGGAGGAAGVLLGGILTDLLSWRWILFINLPIGIGAALLSLHYISAHRDERRKGHFDLLGAIT